MAFNVISNHLWIDSCSHMRDLFLSLKEELQADGRLPS